MKRVGALLVAIAMVGVSLAIRARVDDDGGESGGANGPRRLLCATEVEAVCRALAERDDELEVTSADGAATATDLADSDSREEIAFDAWLAPEPVVELVRGERERRGLEPVLDPPTEPVARSPLVLAVRAERRAALTNACGGVVGWRCLGDLASTAWADLGGEPGWGVLRAGHADPTASATGLLVLGQATSQYFDGRTDLAVIDLDSDPGFPGWLARLEAAGTTPGLGQLVATSMASFDAAGTSEAEAGPVLAEAAPDRADRIALLYLEPVVTVDLVLAPVAGSETAPALRELVTGDDAGATLAAAGWRVPGETRAPGVRSAPPLPPTANLPSPGLLLALQQRWREATS